LFDRFFTDENYILIDYKEYALSKGSEAEDTAYIYEEIWYR